MPFVTVGPAPPDYSVMGILHTIGQTLSNTMWPRWLGGVNRPYFTAAGFANLLDMERLARMAKEGKLRVPIDLCWDFGDALKASLPEFVSKSRLIRGIGIRCNAEQEGEREDRCERLKERLY
jgi:hypothetical protein